MIPNLKQKSILGTECGQPSRSSAVFNLRGLVDDVRTELINASPSPYVPNLSVWVEQ